MNNNYYSRNPPVIPGRGFYMNDNFNSESNYYDYSGRRPKGSEVPRQSQPRRSFMNSDY